MEKQNPFLNFLTGGFKPRTEKVEGLNKVDVRVKNMWRSLQDSSYEEDHIKRDIDDLFSFPHAPKRTTEGELETSYPQTIKLPGGRTRTVVLEVYKDGGYDLKVS